MTKLLAQDIDKFDRHTHYSHKRTSTYCFIFTKMWSDIFVVTQDHVYVFTNKCTLQTGLKNVCINIKTCI